MQSKSGVIISTRTKTPQPLAARPHRKEKEMDIKELEKTTVAIIVNAPKNLNIYYNNLIEDGKNPEEDLQYQKRYNRIYGEKIILSNVLNPDGKFYCLQFDTNAKSNPWSFGFYQDDEWNSLT